jgi:hypothetical protein
MLKKVEVYFPNYFQSQCGYKGNQTFTMFDVVFQNQTALRCYVSSNPLVIVITNHSGENPIINLHAFVFTRSRDSI